MDGTFWKRETLLRLPICFLLLCSSAVFFAIVLKDDTSGIRYWGVRIPTIPPIVLGGSALAFLVAAVLVFFRTRLSYFITTSTALAAVLCLLWIELSNPYVNSWIVFNLQDADLQSWEQQLFVLSLLSISGMLLSSLVFALSLIRLLPEKWEVLGRPVRERTWPAFLGCFVLILL